MDKLGALVVEVGEMELVWRIDLFDKLFAELESWRLRLPSIDEHNDGGRENGWDNNSEFLTWLFGSDETFYCGNGLPYNFHVREVILGEPLTGGWSDD